MLIMLLVLSTFQLDHDPTLLSEASVQYQAIVELILASSSPAASKTITFEILQRFREVYGETAFVCRHLHCPRATSGYKSSDERNKHEKVHVKTLRCADSACEFYVGGFTSKTAVRKHNNKYHTERSGFNHLNYPITNKNNNVINQFNNMEKIDYVSSIQIKWRSNI